MLFVFDLDFTLWDAGGTWCDHTVAPYIKQNGHIRDAEGRRIILYPEVRSILESLQGKEILMGLASRTHRPDSARLLLELFGISHFIRFQQIYPGSKIQHFQALNKESGIPFVNMYFYDDEHRNIEEVSSLGVHARRIDAGLSWYDVKDHLLWEKY